MRKLSLIMGILLLIFQLKAQENPHGDDFSYDCMDCHTTEAWIFSESTASFNHDSTRFKLEGQHIFTDCKACHTTLVFSEAKTNCMDCHTDMHNNTVGLDCARCHDSKSWLVQNITEIHQSSRFPLMGAHNTADCSACHTSASNLEFQPLGIECVDCHRADYQAATNPNHIQARLSTDCIECHKMEAFTWSSQGFNHDFFPLTKGHEVNDCAACHTSGVFEPITSDCYSCHQSDFVSAGNPSHLNSGFTTQCTDCHTTEPDWKPAKFDIHDDFYFPIYSGEHRGEWESCFDCHTQPGNYGVFSCTDCHEHNKNSMDDEHRGINGYSYNSLACYACHPLGKEEGAFNHDVTGFILKGAHLQNDCLDCHGDGFSGTSTLCVSCHTDNYNETQNPNHVLAGISQECEACHTEEGWTPSQFDHTTTAGFELTGSHSGKQCAECHIGTTTAASSECISCHQENYNQAETHLASNYPTDCLQCHNTNNWEDADFDHNSTNFPLTGSHIATECSACHTDGYLGTSMLCSSCHTNNYNEAQNPNHVSAGISNECEICHTTTTWVPSQFDHTATTGFELTGGHSGKQCAECHIGTTAAASSECVSCHQENYNQAENHLASNYSTDCLQCHNTTNWDDADFDHNATNFPLTGAHIATECTACHTDGYTGTSMLCSACHTDSYNEAQNPNHVSAGISNECEICHTTTTWVPSQFDHTATAGFELTGGHSGKQCAECHIGTTTAASSECISCHQENYNQAENHLSSNYPTDCLQCHNTNNWDDADFDHNVTNFPLTGAHIATECSACHTDGYASTCMLCSACHTDSYNEAQNPDHTAAGISMECKSCHSTTAWIPSQFDHTATSGFELTGGHSGKQCAECHIGTTSAASSECISCHQENYNQAENHLASNYPTDCLQCHNSNNWEDADFDHNATSFPLTGEHIATECSACHTDGYAGTSTLCSSCHISNYNESVNPSHTTLGISTNCEDCHTTNPGWEPALFPNHDDYYALNGAHAAVSNNCFLCHEGNYTSTPSSCYGCHSADYNGTTDPAHLAAQFPIDCESCHTETAWEPSTFNHDGQYFPIYSGRHQGEWNSCSDCHTEPTNYSVFSCITCHEHSQAETDDEHDEVGGYVYTATSCFDCHPLGFAEDD